MNRLIRFAMPAFVLALAACGPSGMKPDSADKAVKTIPCEPGSDCQQKWQMARQWIEDNSHFPIMRESDAEIVTDASSGTLYPVVTVRKIQQEDSPAIQFTAECENLIGCVPSEDAYEKSFSDYVEDLAPPEDSGNEVEVGLTFRPETGEVNSGLTIASVAPGSPGAAAGLRPGDRIMKFNGSAINTAAKLNDAVKATAEGSMVPLQYARAGRIYVVYLRL
jgi:membrane-associated protease RseP (regulator of RpoE activity)